MRCLVAGCGYLGSALAARLVAEGHAAFGLRRRPAGLPAGVEPLAADLCDAEALSAVLPDALDAVVYAAAAEGRGAAAYRRAYVEGLRNLLAALPPGPRVLFTSSTSVYGQDDGSWVDEASPAEPARETGRILLAGEALLAASGRDHAIVRLGGLYGPGRTRLLEAVRAGQARIPGGSPAYSNRIHRDDAAAALAHLLVRPSIDSVYLGVDDDPADRAEVLRWMAARLGAAEPGVEDAAGPGYPTGKRCRNGRLRGTGFDLRYPSFREGYEAILAGA